MRPHHTPAHATCTPVPPPARDAQSSLGCRTQMQALAARDTNVATPQRIHDYTAPLAGRRRTLTSQIYKQQLQHPPPAPSAGSRAPARAGGVPRHPQEDFLVRGLSTLLCFCGFPEKGGQRFAAPCPTGAVRCGSRRGAHWCTCTAQPLCRGRRCGWVPCRDCRCSRAAPVGPLQPTLMRRLTAWHRPHRARPIPATTSAIQTARAICGTRTDFASAAQCAATAAPAAAVLSNLTKRRQRRWQPSSRSISLRSTLNLRARRHQNSKKSRLAGTAGTASCSIACHSQERRCAGCMKPGRGSAERGPFGPRSSSPRTRGPMQVRSTCCCAASPSCSHACVGEGVYVMQMLAHVCLSPPGRHVSSDFRYLSLPSHTYTGQDCPGIGKGKLYTADEVARDSSLPYPL